jgi:cytoskeleton protein RodZ
MSELGRILSEARTAKELSLADVEAGTRIRQKYLEALESGAYSDLPRGATARGFLRTYVRYLGLNEEDALQLYAQESGDTDEGVPIAEPGKPRLLDYRPLEVELVDDSPGSDRLRWVIALLVLAALAVAAWWLFARPPGWSLSRGTSPPSSSLAIFQSEPTPTATDTATRWVVTATPQPTETAGRLLPTSDLLPLPTPTVPPTITPTPRPTSTPEVVASIALDLEAMQRSWVRVLVDGAVAEEGVLPAGETRSWAADNSISVRTGNAGGIYLTLNGQDLGRMGEVGQVTERTWVVGDQGQVAETTPGTAVPTSTLTGTPTPAG